MITDIDEVRLKRASELFTEEYAKERGVEIHFVNTAKVDDPVKTLRDLLVEQDLMMYLYMHQLDQ